MEELIDIAFYGRFSSHAQNEQSIEGQWAVCKEYADRNGYRIVKKYIDRAMTGKNDNRPEFQKMMEDSKKKLFKYILVYQLDRFARNRNDSVANKARLKKYGIRVISAKENISDDASGVLIEGVLESMAEYYSAELSEKIRRGMRVSAEKLKFVAGCRPFGYDRDSELRLVRNEAEAPYVEKIFQKYLNGESVKSITEWLNARHLTTPRGKPFNRTSLTTLLKNRKYIGYFTYGDMEVADGVPRLVSDELFEAVQQKIRDNRCAPGRNTAKTDYLLSPFFYCGTCGKPMNGCSATGKLGTTYYYYKCGTRIKNSKACNNSAPHKDRIETFVIDKIFEFLTDPMIERLADSCMRLIDREEKEGDAKRIERGIAENRKKAQNIVAAISLGKAPQLLLDELEKLEQQKSELEMALKEEQLKHIDVTREGLVKYFKTVRKLPRESVMNRRKVLSLFVNRLTWYGDGTVGFRFNMVGKPDKRMEYGGQTEAATVSTSATGALLPAQCSSVTLAAPPRKIRTMPLAQVASFFFYLEKTLKTW